MEILDTITLVKPAPMKYSTGCSSDKPYKILSNLLESVIPETEENLSRSLLDTEYPSVRKEKVYVMHIINIKIVNIFLAKLFFTFSKVKVPARIIYNVL